MSPPARGENRNGLKESLLRRGYAADESGAEAGAPAPVKESSWYSLFGTALVFVWPDTPMDQLRAVACAVIVVIVRVLNIAVPLVYKRVVDTLSDATAGTHAEHGETPQTYSFKQVFLPWILVYLSLYLLQGGGGSGVVGLLSNARAYLWIPVTQSAYRRVSTELFAHLLDLDHSFHLHRKTGEVMRILDRGTSAIQNILGTVVFSIGPQLIDIVTGSVTIGLVLQPAIAVIVFISLGAYIPLTVYLTEWRGQFRSDMNRLDNAKGARATDALLNWETVKLFSNQAFESRQYAKAIADYQRTEYKLLASLNILNVAQSVIIFLGLASGLTVCARGVAKGTLTVGDTILFLSLLSQLYAPLNYFGSYYRNIQQSMLDMGNMLSLLATSPQIQDDEDAKPLVLSSAAISFSHVTHEYTPGNPVLRDVTFSVPGGSTTALVGSTGSGKSSLLRLLFRFYDVKGGAVSIDGQDIASVTQASVRQSMAVVPQDTVLFNDTILYNIRYGRTSATDEEVLEAAKAADIHHAIERFPKGYDTVVGERGLRLSGGEKQRVAIARAILKDPRILILDEATSSLDTVTERRIMRALDAAREGRTAIIVAHRLSTIANADQIVVLQEGRVQEVGSHPELLVQDGVYADMWQRQAATMPESRSMLSTPSSATSLVE